MKKILLILFFAGLLSSCTKDKMPPFVGTMPAHRPPPGVAQILAHLPCPTAVGATYFLSDSSISLYNIIVYYRFTGTDGKFAVSVKSSNGTVITTFVITNVPPVPQGETLWSVSNDFTFLPAGIPGPYQIEIAGIRKFDYSPCSIFQGPFIP